MLENRVGETKCARNKEPELASRQKKGTKGKKTNERENKQKCRYLDCVQQEVMVVVDNDSV